MSGTPFYSANEAPKSYRAVSPSNSAVIGGLQYLFVAVSGNVELQGMDDASSVTFAVTAGALIPFGSGYVRSNTTATVVGIA